MPLDITICRLVCGVVGHAALVYELTNYPVVCSVVAGSARFPLPLMIRSCLPYKLSRSSPKAP